MAYSGPEFCEMGHTTNNLRCIKRPQDIQDVIGVLRTHMVGIGDGDGIA